MSKNDLKDQKKAVNDAKNEELESERYQRALADYQNLVRRTREERAELIKFAAQNVLEDLIEPYEHLLMAAEQFQDSGIQMVVAEFARIFTQHGLEEIHVLGKQFDLETMEAVERHGESDRVTKVVKKGFRLNGKVIRHAKVILGEQ